MTLTDLEKRLARVEEQVALLWKSLDSLARSVLAQQIGREPTGPGLTARFAPGAGIDKITHTPPEGTDGG